MGCLRFLALVMAILAASQAAMAQDARSAEQLYAAFKALDTDWRQMIRTDWCRRRLPEVAREEIILLRRLADRPADEAGPWVARLVREQSSGPCREWQGQARLPGATAAAMCDLLAVRLGDPGVREAARALATAAGCPEGARQQLLLMLARQGVAAIRPADDPTGALRVQAFADEALQVVDGPFVPGDRTVLDDLTELADALTGGDLGRVDALCRALPGGFCWRVVAAQLTLSALLARASGEEHLSEAEQARLDSLCQRWAGNQPYDDDAGTSLLVPVLARIAALPGQWRCRELLLARGYTIETLADAKSQVALWARFEQLYQPDSRMSREAGALPRKDVRDLLTVLQRTGQLPPEQAAPLVVHIVQRYTDDMRRLGRDARDRQVGCLYPHIVPLLVRVLDQPDVLSCARALASVPDYLSGERMQLVGHVAYAALETIEPASDPSGLQRLARFLDALAALGLDRELAARLWCDLLHEFGPCDVPDMEALMAPLATDPTRRYLADSGVLSVIAHLAQRRPLYDNETATLVAIARRWSTEHAAERRNGLDEVGRQLQSIASRPSAPLELPKLLGAHGYVPFLDPL